MPIFKSGGSNIMFHLMRKFKVPNQEDYYLILKKPWGRSIGVPLEGKLGYMLVHTTEFKTYDIIDEKGEDDGFEDYIGAEQFLRAYLSGTVKKVPNRWYINLFINKPNGYLEELSDGKEIKY